MSNTMSTRDALQIGQRNRYLTINEEEIVNAAVDARQPVHDPKAANEGGEFGQGL